MSSKNKLWGENKPFLFYARRDSNLETLFNICLFHGFEQQHIDSCVPLFNAKTASVAMIRQGRDIIA